MLYCCTVDVVTRKLPQTKVIRYPDIRKKLLKLAADDQKLRQSREFYSTDLNIIKQITEQEDRRIEKVLEVLREIKTPSVKNVDLDGSRAIWLIALHNINHKDAGKIVLAKMRQLYYRNKNQVFYPGIPYLVDRVMIGSRNFDHQAKQLYGTQGWYVKNGDEQIDSGRFPIINPRGLSMRRKKFDLTYSRKTVLRCRHRI
ncbi:MAG: hypothetical protein HY226_04635 [Candidatus Vogelbacteria bacterium]|nr:hypothetical protein [Candidatus Vogelbacteria bacterium]